ncbi:hypothetical protein E2C05_19165 [Paracraurococcus ruber]|uniref:Uncharacterized protein n=1 Tax=Paracraurococcus ruber TaxID=77675 RepID=A0ABS1D4R3_9PROT|nr:hypothetical protein [Paracraurococcus ruber]TDG28903.1 hypothetical protein E2C05_19165 [Paracraurococcus ruber]
MSRTYHHSAKWGRCHRHNRGPRRSVYGGGRVGEAPGWYVRLCDERPGRHADRLVEHRLVRGYVDPDAAVFWRTGRRAPHTWHW